MTMRTTTIPMAVKTPGGNRWELCSFCDQRWATRQYESVSRCGAHSETPLDALRRERDEARAALVEAERVAEGVVQPARDIARMRRERDEARRLLSAVTDEIEKATTERIRLPQHDKEVH